METRFMKTIIISVLILLRLFLAGDVAAQKFKTAVGLTGIQPTIEQIKYSTNAGGNPGFGLSIKQEYNFHRNIGMMLRLEYQNWGLEFDGLFYDYPDHTGGVGFDKYHHKIRVNEILVPVLVKFDTDSLFKNKALYLFGGYLVRGILGSKTEITENITNSLLYSGEADFRYYGSFFGGNTFVGGLGFNFMLAGSDRMFYSELNYYHATAYYLYSGKKNYSTNDLGIKILSMTVAVGIYL